jgi:hypothetical protein
VIYFDLSENMLIKEEKSDEELIQLVILDQFFFITYAFWLHLIHSFIEEFS